MSWPHTSAQRAESDRVTRLLRRWNRVLPCPRASLASSYLIAAHEGPPHAAALAMAALNRSRGPCSEIPTTCRTSDRAGLTRAREDYRSASHKFWQAIVAVADREPSWMWEACSFRIRATVASVATVPGGAGEGSGGSSPAAIRRGLSIASSRLPLACRITARPQGRAGRENLEFAHAASMAWPRGVASCKGRDLYLLRRVKSSWLAPSAVPAPYDGTHATHGYGVQPGRSAT
jgi:hypothetical protein